MLSVKNFIFYTVNEIDFIKAVIYMKGGWKWGTSFPEILVIEPPPSNERVSTWQASKKIGSGGGGVSSL